MELGCDGAPMHVPLLLAGSDVELPAPGETVSFNVPVAVLSQLKAMSSTSFVVAAAPHVEEMTSGGTTFLIGLLLEILQLNVTDDTVDTMRLSNSSAMRAECRCPCRVRVTSVQQDAVAVCSPFHDVFARTHGERVALAKAEWDAWQAVQECASAAARLGNGKEENGMLSDLIRTWAPRDYDRDIGLDEWDQTPVDTRDVWSRRAESFSFAVVREAAPRRLRAALVTTSTKARLAEGVEGIAEQRRRIAAKQSVREALGE